VHIALSREKEWRENQRVDEKISFLSDSREGLQRHSVIEKKEAKKELLISCNLRS
jgi:hypothetical protein